MTAKNGPSSPVGRAACPKFSLRRLVPLAVIVVMSVVRRGLGLASAALVRNARPPPRGAARTSSRRTRCPRLRPTSSLYIVAVGLSLPVGFYLTVIGGILFGAMLGGAAAMVGATIGAICIFLIARSAVGEHLVRRAGPLAEKLAQGFRDDAFSYLLFLRLVPIFPFWVINLVAALCGVRLRDLRGGDRARHHSGDLHLRLLRRRPRQRDRRAAGRLPILPRRRAAGLPAQVPNGCRAHAGAAGGARGARRAGARPGRGETPAGALARHPRRSPRGLIRKALC